MLPLGGGWEEEALPLGRGGGWQTMPIRWLRQRGGESDWDGDDWDEEKAATTSMVRDRGGDNSDFSCDDDGIQISFFFSFLLLVAFKVQMLSSLV